MGANWGLSESGLKIVNEYRVRRGFGKTDYRWYYRYCGLSTLRRFLSGTAISSDTFTDLCLAINIPEEQIRSLVNWPGLGISETQNEVGESSGVLAVSLIGYIKCDDLRLRSKVEVISELMDYCQHSQHQELLVLSGTYSHTNEALVRHAVAYLVKDLDEPHVIWKNADIHVVSD